VTPFGFPLVPTLLLELALELPRGVAEHVPTGLQQESRTPPGSGRLNPRSSSALALGLALPVEPNRVGGLWGLDPGLPPHGYSSGMPVLLLFSVSGQVSPAAHG